MELQVRQLARTRIIVILAVFTPLLAAVLCLPGAHADVCIVPALQECYNATYSTATGLGSYNVGACTAVSGTLDPSTSDVKTIDVCSTGCCCGTSPQWPQNIKLACVDQSLFTPTTTDFSCTQSCAGTPVSHPACGEGTITQADVDAQCTCGSSTATLVGQYCCWDSSLAASAAACPLPSTICATSQAATQACMCGSQAISPGQVCCAANSVAASLSECPTGGGGSTSGSCGDGVINAGEQCDAVYNWDPVQQKFVLSTGTACTDPALYCTSQCTCSQNTQTATCGNGFCDSTESTSSCPQDCPPAPVCTASTTSVPSPVIGAHTFSATPAPSVSLSWQIQGQQCANSILGFVVQRSTVSADAAKTVPEFVSQQLTSSQLSYQDSLPTDITSTATVLYYAIGAIYRTATGTDIGWSTTSVTFASAQCPTASAQYCLDAKHTVLCTDFQPKVAACSGTCIMQGSGSTASATCVAQASCALCNGLYASFADPYFTLPATATQGKQECGRSTTCYLDLADTTAYLYQSCSAVDSCIQYRTQEACSLNQCTRPGGATPATSCDWIAQSTELDSGICRPHDPAFQNCSLCNDLGSGCTQSTCGNMSSLAPSSCYYHTPASQLFGPETESVCKDKSSTPCEYLHTQLECEGGTQYVLNAQYDAAGTRTSGDNSITSRSNDVLGHGLCAWFPDTRWAAGGYCAKDSDDNGEADYFQILHADPKITGQALASLLTDFNPPINTVASVSGTEFPRAFSVRIAGSSIIFDRICPVAQASNCYPTPQTTLYVADPKNKGAGLINKEFAVDAGGQYVLMYYGEDSSHNIEPLKRFDFSIDATPPQITITSQALTPYVSTGNKLLTSAYIAFTTSEASKCTTQILDAKLSRYTQSGGTELNGASGQSFGVTYPKLADGQYALNITCTDTNGNTNLQTTPTLSLPLPILVDSDLAISNPWPRDNATPIKNSTVTLHIETAQPATCRYAPKTTALPAWSAMTPYAQTGGTIHESTISVTTGSYVYVSACSSNGITLYSNGDQDLIKFRIDQTAPTTQVCDEVKTGTAAKCVPAVLGSANKQETYQLSLRCTDNGSVMSGCDYQTNIYSCAYQQGQPACTPTLGYELPPITGTTPWTLLYYAVDAAGNKEATHTDTISAFDLTPPPPPLWSITP